MEAEAKAFENEKKNNSEEDDHDTRKLPKPERMRLVVKNKDVRLTALVLETVASFQRYIFFSIFGALCSNCGVCASFFPLDPPLFRMN